MTERAQDNAFGIQIVSFRYCHSFEVNNLLVPFVRNCNFINDFYLVNHSTLPDLSMIVDVDSLSIKLIFKYETPSISCLTFQPG